MPRDLDAADDAHLAVLAACWGASVADVLDRDRVWLQCTGPGDAPGPRVVRLHDRVLTLLEPPGEVVRSWAPRMVGLRGLVRPEHAARGDGALPARVLSPEDDGAALALHADVPAADLGAASPLPSAALLAVGTFVGGVLIGIAALVETPAGPPEISVLVGPGARGRGVAVVLELEVLRRAVGRWEWVQHRTVESDTASRRLAARCGFRLVSVEHLVREAPADG